MKPSLLRAKLVCSAALALIAASDWSVPAVAAERGEARYYLKRGEFKAGEILAPPPQRNSEEQAADMAQVVSVAHTCTTNEAAAAFAEKKLSAFNFGPAIGVVFLPGRFPKTEAFMERVKDDAAAAVDEAKEFWKRPRPYTLNPTLAGGKLETSFSYPSGHSTGATVLALTLAELFPEKQEEIMTVSRNIGWRRVKIARHYPTDIYAGRVFALVILRQMKASPAFQTDFADSEQEIANVSSAHPEWQRPVPKPEAARAPELLPR